MAAYSLKSFLRNTPNALLKEYLEGRSLLPDFNWTVSENDQLRDLGETEIDDLSESISELGLSISGSLEQDFRDICSMADDHGVQCLVEQASSPVHNINLSREYCENKIEGYHARVMWAWLKHNDVFEYAYRNQYLDSMSAWKDCEIGVGLPCDSDQSSLDRLAQAISEYLKKQAKGRHCQVDYYHRQVPDRHCFFAYPEDSAKPEMRYNDQGNLIRSARRPVFEVVFMYEPESGILRVHARGAKTVKVMQELFCKEILDLDGVPDENTRVYDLANLKNPNFRFQTEPMIDTVKLKSLSLDMPGREQVIIKIEPRDGQEMKLHERMVAIAAAYKATMGNIIIKRAKMQAVFKPEEGRKPKTVTFAVGLPDYSTLEDNKYHNIIKRHIDKWGFRRRLLDDIEAEVA